MTFSKTDIICDINGLMWWDYAGSEDERKRVLGYSHQEGSGMHWWFWSQVTSKRLLSLGNLRRIFFLNIEGFRSKSQPTFFCLSHFFPSITNSTLLFEGLTHHHWLVTPNYSTLFLLIPPFFLSLSLALLPLSSPFMCQKISLAPLHMPVLNRQGSFLQVPSPVWH